MTRETREAGSWRDFLLGGSISKSDTKIDLLTTNLEGEYIFDKAFLYLTKEYSLSLY